MKSKKINFEVFDDASQSGVAYKNRALKRTLIRHIDRSGSSTITELSKVLNTSVPKTTALVNELIEDGLIQDEGKLDSTGGRRASTYGLVAEACFFVGVDVKKYHVNFGMMDFKKRMVNQKNKLPFKLENTPDALARLVQLIRDFLAHSNTEKTRILGLGINLPGRINHRTGQSYNYFHFNETPLAEHIEKEIGIASFLENDSRAMAFGAFFGGDVLDEKNVLFINMDYGMGMGIMIEGNVYYGQSGFSGEFSHTPLFENNIRCHCGKIGCLETEASGSAMLRKFRDKIKNGSTSSAYDKKKDLEELTITDIIEAAQQEDPLSIEVLAEVGEKLGKGLAVLINILNPGLLILGGTLSETGDYIRLPARNALNRFSVSLVNNDTSILISRLGEKAGVMGGCLNARNKVMY